MSSRIFDYLNLTIMKRKTTILLLLTGIILITGCSLNQIVDVISPDGSNKFVFSIEAGLTPQHIASVKEALTPHASSPTRQQIIN